MASSTLAPLPDVEVLSPLVARILGQNPGMYTLQGTNTYIVGSGRERLLIDTGDGIPAWKQLLETTARAAGFVITAVVLTHHHHDHVGGLNDLRDLAQESLLLDQPLRVYKQPDVVHDQPQWGSDLLPVADGSVIAVPGATLRVLATPGHTDDHISLFLEEENALFAGDMVLGHGTAVFTSLRLYMASLAKALEAQPSIIYPGHGPVVHDGACKLREYIDHRLTRENQVLDLLKEFGAKGHAATIPELVAVIYAAYPVNLHVPAQGSILHHLHKLQEEGRVRNVGAASEGDPDRWLLADVVEASSSL